MIFKKDNVVFGSILGFIAPLLGIVIYKFYVFGNVFSFKETFQYLLFQTGHAMISAALTLSLLLNALLFTIYINTNRDKTAKGIFILTVCYALVVLSIKTFS